MTFRTGDRASGIDGLEMGTLQLSPVALEVPPREAVLGADHHRRPVQVRGQALRHGGQAVRFEGHEHRVRLPQHSEVVGRLDAHHRLSLRLDKAEAVRAHGG